VHQIALEHTWEPTISRDEAEAKLANWHRATERAKRWA
jgi:glycerol kinase